MTDSKRSPSSIPPDSIEIRRTIDGELDEIVASDASIHLERMDRGYWWMRVSISNGQSVEVRFRSNRTIGADVEVYK